MSANTAASMAASARPESVTNMWINFAGLGAAVFAYLALTRLGLAYTGVAIGSMVSLAVVIASLELTLLQTHKRATAGLRFEQLPPHDFKRVGIKQLGFYFTIALIALVYWIGEYFNYGFYTRFWQGLVLVWPYAIAVQVVYFFYVDRRMHEPEDGYWKTGCLVLGRWQEFTLEEFRQYALGWTVKGFFLPLMFVELAAQLGRIHPPDASFLQFYDFMFLSAFAIDLVFTCVGYVLTLRLFDSHIRSTEPTFFGWAVTIICYYPLWGFIYDNFLPYQDSYIWSAWLSRNPTWQIVWGSAIIALNVVYVWATVAFGIRFSNLTHRGILTNGPYRYTKHPAYVAKNLSWWLIAVPFLPAHSWTGALGQCLMLFAVNIIYYWRARTEELHLSRDPDYVRYAEWMNEHSVFRAMHRPLPFLKYRAPAYSR